MADESFQWLALYLVEGLGNVGAHCLLRAFGDPANIFNASGRELARVQGIGERTARNIVARRYALDPEKEMARIERLGARIIHFESSEYPEYLKQIHDPPIILYAKGSPIPKTTTFIAIVGSRNSTHYGTKVAAQLAKELGGVGIGVVSGMARGIDGAAQWGCLKAGGFTIGVVGNGLDIIYPTSNKRLFEAVWEHGAVVSEFPMRTPPEPRHFPIRNRIISGISKGVVVVEATRKSGSLITASQALEQGRDVFAVPGSIYSSRSEGTHFLIKQGAKLVHRVQDILEEIIQPELINPERQSSDVQDIPPGLNEVEKRVYDFLGDYPKHIDEIARELDLDSGQISSVLLNMELNGFIKQLPGKVFVRS